jgi:hypothetical protein
MKFHAYACGSPIRQPIVKAAAKAVDAPFHPEANPVYKGGDAIVWGLIRGSRPLIDQIKSAGHTYYHMDNGYFGRNSFFRLQKEANQYTGPITYTDPSRWERMAKIFGYKFRPWNKDGKNIVLALSTEHLFKFYGDDLKAYINRTVAEIRKHTDRPIIIRHKKNSTPIEDELLDCFALVTHTSASALDAFRMGVPVFTTGECCAKPLSLQDLSKIETPIYPAREPLFWDLAWRIFSPNELARGMWLESS